MSVDFSLISSCLGSALWMGRNGSTGFSFQTGVGQSHHCHLICAIEIYRLQTITPPLMSYPSFSDTCEMGQTKVDVLIFEVKEIHEKACAQDPQGWPVAGSRIKSTSSQTLHMDLPLRNGCDIRRPSARVHRVAHILLSNSLKATVNLSSVKETILCAPVLTNCHSLGLQEQTLRLSLA